MKQEHINLRELKDFIEKHDLRDKYSNFRFFASVSISTANNEIIDEEMTVMITFNDLGEVSLMSNDLDPLLFPSAFKARWQNMIHVENVFLKISDVHKKNPTIGKYIVKIVPIGKLI